MRPPLLLCSWFVRARTSNDRFATRFPIPLACAAVPRESELLSWRGNVRVGVGGGGGSRSVRARARARARSPVSRLTVCAREAMSRDLCVSCENPKWNRFGASYCHWPSARLETTALPTDNPCLTICPPSRPKRPALPNRTSLMYTTLTSATLRQWPESCNLPCRKTLRLQRRPRSACKSA